MKFLVISIFIIAACFDLNEANCVHGGAKLLGRIQNEPEDPMNPVIDIDSLYSHILWLKELDLMVSHEDLQQAQLMRDLSTAIRDYSKFKNGPIIISSATTHIDDIQNQINATSDAMTGIFMQAMEDSYILTTIGFNELERRRQDLEYFQLDEDDEECTDTIEEIFLTWLKNGYSCVANGTGGGQIVAVEYAYRLQNIHNEMAWALSRNENKGLSDAVITGRISNVAHNALQSLLEIIDIADSQLSDNIIMSAECWAEVHEQAANDIPRAQLDNPDCFEEPDD